LLVHRSELVLVAKVRVPTLGLAVAADPDILICR
jgi:hypothetical protein